MKHIPKRTLIPILTDILEYNQAANNTIPYTQKIVQRYGDVCEASFTGVKNYFIHDPELIKEILTTLGPKMKRTRLFRAFRKFLGNGLFTSDGDFHKQQRRLIKPVFYPQRVAEYAGIMVACAEAEIDTWKDGDTIHVNEAMTRITLQVITQTMFGSSLDPEVIDRARRLLAEAFALMNRILQNPFSLYCLEKEIRTPAVRKFFRLRAELDRIIHHIIGSYRRHPDSSRLDLLSMLLDARDEETGAGMSDEQIRDEVLTFFLAGHETTTLALTWTFYLLGKNPGIADRFHAELQQVLGERSPEATDYQNLPLTKNIFRESLRLYPPAWTFARETTEDTEICGYRFPKGSVLWTVTYLLHHNERYFHDAEAFLPNRWDEPEARDIPKYAYFPFGGGNRMCIGEGFAWMEGVLVLAAIGSRFRLELPEGFSTGIDPVFTLKTKEPVLMKAVRLTTQAANNPAPKHGLEATPF